MKKLLFLGMFASALWAAPPARAGGSVSVQVGWPVVSVLFGCSRVVVQAAPVTVGVALAVPVVRAPAAARPAPAHPQAVVYQGPYPSYIAPPYRP